MESSDDCLLSELFDRLKKKKKVVICQGKILFYCFSSLLRIARVLKFNHKVCAIEFNL